MFLLKIHSNNIHFHIKYHLSKTNVAPIFPIILDVTVILMSRIMKRREYFFKNILQIR
jgi:hypothetical protein